VGQTSTIQDSFFFLDVVNGGRYIFCPVGMAWPLQGRKRKMKKGVGWDGMDMT